MNMNGKYVDGYVVPVKRERLEEYKELAKLSSQVWKDHGALDYVECIAEDVKPGKVTSFPQSVQLQEDEIVVFAWIVYESRSERDRINEAAMKDPRFADMDMQNMPLDGRRMFFGGFDVLVQG